MNSLTVFTNELGNRIVMQVSTDTHKGVTVSASGPTSQVEHTWTPKEASELVTLLSDVGVKPYKKSRFRRK